jgi:hypothetical protein
MGYNRFIMIPLLKDFVFLLINLSSYNKEQLNSL